MGNILIVDDARLIRLTVKDFLEEDGHRVEAAADADSAMAILKSGPVDVVFTWRREAENGTSSMSQWIVLPALK